MKFWFDTLRSRLLLTFITYVLYMLLYFLTDEVMRDFYLEKHPVWDYVVDILTTLQAVHVVGTPLSQSDCILRQIAVIFLITQTEMPQKLIPNHRTINSKQFLNCLMKFCKHSNQCLLTTAFPDRIITRRSRLQKPADIVAVASAYRSIRCKIINFIPDEVICVETRRYSTPAFDRSIQSIVTCLSMLLR